MWNTRFPWWHLSNVIQTMQAQNVPTQSCIQCSVPLKGNAIRYLLSDMAAEMLAWVELKLKLEVNESSCLCGKCFTIFRNTWAAIQEPEVMHFTEAEEHPDPLSGIKLFSEEPQVKSEEPRSFEHYDYKVEINMSLPIEQEPTSINLNEEKFEVDVEDKAEYEENIEEQNVNTGSDDEKKVSDWEPNVQELSSDEEMDVEIPPPVLDGNSLRYGSKCDWCSILLKNKQYRKLLDGPEKEVVVNRTFNKMREHSPERVCNSCWNKAHSAVNAEKKKRNISLRSNLNNEEGIEKTTEPNSEVSITIPGYQRFPNTSNKCMVPGCKRTERVYIPQYLKIVLLKSYNLFVPESTRICVEHSKEYHRDWSFLKQHKYMADFSSKDVTAMLDLLREEALKHPD